MTLEDKYKSSLFASIGKKVDPSNDISIFTGESGYAKNIKTGTITKSYPDDKSVVGPWRNRLPGGGQPYVEIFPYDSPTERHLNSLGDRMLPVGSGARDIARISEFLISGPGVVFLSKQVLLRLANPTIETKIFNPLSMYAQYARVWGGLIPGAGSVVKGHLGNPLLGGASRYFNEDDPGDSALVRKTTDDSRIVHQADKIFDRIDVLAAANSFKKVNPNRYTFPVDANLVLTSIELAKLGPQKASGEKYSANVKVQDDSVSAWKIEDPSTVSSTKPATNSVSGLISSIANVTAKVAPYVPLVPLGPVSSVLNSIEKTLNGVSVAQNKFTSTDKYLTYVNRISSDTSKLNKILNNILDGVVEETVPIAGEPLDKNLDIDRPILQDNFTFRKFNKEDSNFKANVYVNAYGLIPGTTSNSELKYGEPGSEALLQKNNNKMSVTKTPSDDTTKLYDSRTGYNHRTTQSIENYGLVTEEVARELVKNDYIKFAFTSVSLPQNKTAIFRATLTSLSDVITPTWNSDEFVGRADIAYTYKNFERSITFKFNIAIANPVDLIPTYDKLNFLQGFCYPAGYVKDNIGMLSPLLKLTIGDLYKNVLGFFETFTFTVEDESTWEIENGYQVPKYVSVDIGFKTIWSSTKTPPESSGRHMAFGNMVI